MWLVRLPLCFAGTFRQQRDGLHERPGTHRGLEKTAPRFFDPAPERRRYATIQEEALGDQEAVGQRRNGRGWCRKHRGKSFPNRAAKWLQQAHKLREGYR